MSDMTTAAHASAALCKENPPGEHPVIAALRRAPKMSPEMSTRCRTLMAECKADRSDPMQWIPEAEFWRRVRAMRGGRTGILGPAVPSFFPGLARL